MTHLFRTSTVLALAALALPHVQAASILGQLPTSGERIVSTVPHNGDQNPYGVAFVPEGFPGGGPLETGDILVSNFNNSQNQQGTGTTIVKITPAGNVSVFFHGPRV